MLCMGDQLTDILVAWRSTFAGTLLLIASCIFCVTNAAVPMIYILSKFSIENNLTTTCIVTLHNKFCSMNEKSGGWVFHHIANWGYEFLRFIPADILILCIDAAWILFRIFVMLTAFLLSLFCQVLLLVIGVVLCTVKLIQTRQLYTWFWTYWNKQVLEDNKIFKEKENDNQIANVIIIVELIFESLPQFVIQLLNALFLSTRITILELTSICFSALMLATIANFFFFHMRNGTKFSKTEKFDIMDELQ